MRILCATDLMPKSEAAIDRAGSLAAHLGADLTLLHVVVPGESDWPLEQALRSAILQLQSRTQPPLWHAQRTPRVTVQAGHPARLIVATAEQSNARLVILGAHEKRPWLDALEGTIAEKVLAERISPVLVVQNEVRAPYRRVLLALDMSDASASAIKAAESLVITPDVHATIVHAYEPPYQGMLHYADIGLDTIARYADSWHQEARRAVRGLLHCESDQVNRYDIVIEPQPAGLGILGAIERYEPDLLVMGTHGGGRLRRALVGSVANRVLHETTCDVLIVPNGSAGAIRSESVLGRRHLRQLEGGRDAL